MKREMQFIDIHDAHLLSGYAEGTLRHMVRRGELKRYGRPNNGELKTDGKPKRGGKVLLDKQEVLEKLVHPKESA